MSSGPAAIGARCGGVYGNARLADSVRADYDLPMALFALWPSHGAAAPEVVHRRMQAEAHVVPELVTGRRLGARQLSVFATTTRFYSPAQQSWHDPATGGACVLHGVAWQVRHGRALLLDACMIAGLLGDPSRDLPEDVAGEYSILRVFADGRALAFSDRAGLHQLFHTAENRAAVANRAAFLAALREDWHTDARTLIWLPTIGYRVGEGTSYRGVHAVPQGRALIIGHGRHGLRPLPQPVVAFPDRRGFVHGGAALLEEGIAQAHAAVRLATDGQDRIDLPITGGKDSRAVLALCLSAGLRDRLRLVTRGYEGHPDVIAGRLVAAACGLPHERQAPLGSDAPAHWTLDMFVSQLAAQTFQADGMVGGWDLILGHRTGTGTLVTGHMGEVLKSYSKRPIPGGPLDPVEMVRLQAPFDPLGLLRPEAVADLRAQLRAQMDHAVREGATRDDLPDVFYYRNRIPNWLGAIRGIKSFERQPIMPLGVPALMRLAFLLTPEERRMEVVHHRLVRDLAPSLLPPPFAVQQWHPRLECAGAEPIMPAVSPVFGNWQYSLNHNPAIRAWLAAFFARQDLSLWQALRRDVLTERLRHRTFDYFDGISLLGLVIAAFQEAGLVRPAKLAASVPIASNPVSDRPACMPFHDRATGDVTEGATAPPVAIERPAACDLHGYLDAVTGTAEAEGNGVFRIGGTGTIALHGWLYAADMPGARLAVNAVSRGQVLATAVADQVRPDLVQAGLGDGAHAFALHLDSATLSGTDAVNVVLTALDQDFVPVGGRLIFRR